MSWDPSQHPRAAAGAAGGGQFAAKGGSSSSSGGQTPAATTQQIKDFQKKYGLPVTGKFDARTLSVFKHAHDKPAKKKAAKKPRAKRKAAKKPVKTPNSPGGKSTKTRADHTSAHTRHTTKAAKHKKPTVKKPHITRPPKKVVRKVSIGGRRVH
jgi:hypothetical protein